MEEKEDKTARQLIIHKGQIAKSNLIGRLLFALELESANAILRLHIFPSSITGDPSLASSSSSSIYIVNDFIIFIVIISIMIAVNQIHKRFDKKNI